MLKLKTLLLHLTWLLFYGVLFAQYASAQETQTTPTFVVGTENIAYYPHYDLTNAEKNGYLSALLKRFAAEHNIEFIFVALPNKRLHLAMEQGVVDFAYPDNPDWGKSPRDPLLKKRFSAALTQAMGGTIVHKQNKGLGLAKFDSLAVPFGFTPIKWESQIKGNAVRLVEVDDALRALELVSLNRVSGADIEYHVAKHLISSRPRLQQLTMDPDLPYDIVGFSLSTYLHSDVLAMFDNYIKANPAAITALQREYGLDSPDRILARLSSKLSETGVTD